MIPFSIVVLVGSACLMQPLEPVQASSRLASSSQARAVSLHAVRSVLLDDVRKIVAPGIPGPLVVYGHDAFVVATGRFDRQGNRAPVVAAAEFDGGRVVAFGHTGYLDRSALEIADTARLMINAVHWAGRRNRTTIGHKGDQSVRASPVRIAVVNNDPLRAMFDRHGLQSDSLPLKEIVTRLDRFDVICLGQSALDDHEIAAVRKHLRSGGGLIMAGLGWGWLQLNPEKSLDMHPGNRLLADAGIAWGDGYLRENSDGGFLIDCVASPNCHALSAIGTLEASAKASSGRPAAEVSQSAVTALLAVRTVGSGDQVLLPRIRRLSAAHRDGLVPTERSPLTSNRHALGRVLLAFEIVEALRTPPAEIQGHPAAEHFPGAVPADATRVTRLVELVPGVSGWQSTGLYAAPGDVVEIRFPKTIDIRGHAVRIGAHIDELYHHDSWKRAPQISRRFRLSAHETRVVNAFGGLIYIECPGDAKSMTDVSISGAVEAPHFVLGKTNVDDWKRRIRYLPGPWAELASSKIVVTVPSTSVRALDDPESLMRFWDRVSDAHASLAAIPLERKRPERFVADIQISAGYMHAGYPIMTHLDATKPMTQLDVLRQGSWGLLHELGHNHQSPDWTFDGTGEVTCNLFALHAIDTICEPPAGTRGHSTVDKPPSYDEYVRRGAKFDEWKRDPFLALQMYVQLQREFGWDPFQRVFEEYRQLAAAERPKGDAEKRDQWLVRFSRACGRNLGPFFVAWGVPTSDQARDSISDLAVWLPGGVGGEPNGDG